MAATHVVIAEPDASIREELVALVAEAAEALGVSVAVHEATTGTSAFAACSDHKPALLIAEVLLEGLSGLTLMRRIAVESKTQTAVVLVTDLSREHDRYWALRNGATAYLAKPFDATTLRSKVQRVLAEGPSISADSPARL
ncbi:MAG: response regulator [Nannocystaceae bacterium]|nr:response regulator [bacterium]